MGARVRRTPATRDVRGFAIEDAAVAAGPVPPPSMDGGFDEAVPIEFVIEASGGGGTRIMVGGGTGPGALARLASSVTLVAMIEAPLGGTCATVAPATFGMRGGG